MAETEKPTYLSIIVPLYNEEENVAPLYDAIAAVVSGITPDFEVLFVDDGSKDATFERAAELAGANPELRAIKFRRNYGQTPAMAAGIDLARGDILVTMDGDLQNDPDDIPQFIRKIEEGYDIVVGWRFDRQDKLVTRKIPSRIANWLIGKITGVPIKDNGCSLKAYRSEIIKTVPLYSEMHRFIPAMASLAGSRVAEIKVRHHARRFGVSKYGLSRIYKVLLDLLAIKTIVSFASRPLFWFSMLAAPSLAFGLGLILFSMSAWMNGADDISVMLSGSGLLFCSAACFLLLGGALGELVYKTGDIKLKEFASLTACTYSCADDIESKNKRTDHD